MRAKNMTKKEFAAIAQVALSAGKIEVMDGLTSLNNGMLYRANVNKGRAVVSSDKFMIDATWKAAKKAGGFNVYSTYHNVNAEYAL
jgi:hypothetical protein